MSTKTETREMSTAMDLDALDIRPNPWNKVRPLDAAFLASIASQGILSPILVRPTDDGDKAYEIICGHRRWLAACETGSLTVPAVMRVMDDQEAQLCTLIENTHREDMTPWQEAQLIGELLARPDWDIATAAAATGWSESMIRRRAKLLEISPKWKEMMDAGELAAWTVGHFEVLAVFDEKAQEELHKDIHSRANGLTLAELKEEIADRSKALKAAPFDLDDVTLVPKAGACTACPKRSDAQADLFGEVPDIVKAGSSCLDESCFSRKLTALTKRKESQLLEKHPEAIKVAKNHGTGGKGALNPHQYMEAKKADKGAVPALQYGERGQVTLAYVKVKKSAEEKDKSPRALAKEAERKLQARIDALAIEKLTAIIEDKDTEFAEEAYPLLVQYCLVDGAGMEIEDDEAAAARVRAYVKKPVKVEEMWPAVADRLVRSLRNVVWNLENKKEDIRENADVKLAAWMVDADFEAIRKEAAAELAQGPAESQADAAKDELDMDGDEDDGLDGDSEGGL